MSFVELLPSSLVVSLCFSGAGVIHKRSREKIRLGQSIVYFVFMSAWFTIALAFMLSFVPKMMPVQIK